MHICIGELGKHWFSQWLVACSAPSHYLEQCLLIVNWTLGKERQWNSNGNTKLFIHENAFENGGHLSRGGELMLWSISDCQRHMKEITSTLVVSTSPTDGLALLGAQASVGTVMTKLTHWGWDKMAVIFQTTFSNRFSWMKMLKFWLKIHWSLFLRVHLTIIQHWFR